MCTYPSSHLPISLTQVITEHWAELSALYSNFLPAISHMVVYMSGEGNGNPLQYSCLENAMDREAWQATVHEVAKSQTQLSN